STFCYTKYSTFVSDMLSIVIGGKIMHNMSSQTDILLDSGTNELEVVMFNIGTGLYGINVLKVREIVNALPVTSIPNAHQNVEGVIRLREEVLPVVNLAKVLAIPESKDPLQDKFIIAELNQIKIAFRVHDVSRIYRISWVQIEKPSEILSGQEAYAIGIIKIEDLITILNDYKKIFVDINNAKCLIVERIEVIGLLER